MVRPFDLTHDLRSAMGNLTTLSQSRMGAITPTLGKENRRQNRGNPNGDLSVGLLCRSSGRSAYWTKVQYTGFQFFDRGRACKCKTTTTNETTLFVWPSTTSTLWSSSEIMMALSRRPVGMALNSVPCWLRCRPIRAGPLGLRRAMEI